MVSPFFSVVIFTKNRSDVVGFTLQSVLSQSYEDFEVVVSDNDDANSTHDVISRYCDSRIRYHRTDGTLSMVENWENGLSLSRGRYVISLTDRSALKSYALEKIKQAVDRYRQDAYVWGYDQYDDQSNQVEMLKCSRSPAIVTSSNLFKHFLSTGYNSYGTVLPRGLNSCFSSSLLERIRRTTGGRVCLPVSPDFTQAFLALAHCQTVVLMNEPLYVWGYKRLSNGGGLYRETDLIKRFFHDMNLAEEDTFKHVPVKTVGTHNSLCNDLMSLKAGFPEVFRGVEINLVPYFVECHEEIRERLLVNDPLYSKKMRAWKVALDAQPIEIAEEARNRLRKIAESHQSELNSRKVTLSLYKRAYGKVAREVRRMSRRLYKYEADDTESFKPVSLSNILEAVAWIEDKERGGHAFTDASVALNINFNEHRSKKPTMPRQVV